ncbi:MAG: hypothetical protein K2J60_11380 [Acetatifactor sp.]|nr:hypothetical protein [Acetatifactor sp.]
MQRHYFILIIMVCSVLLTGCNNYEGIENTEEISELKESEPTTEKSVLDYKWQEMPDLEVPYIPELGYHESLRIRAILPTDYVCWKDLLVIGNKVYRRKNGIYERTEERPQDWFDIEDDDLDSYKLKQYENLLIAQDEANSKIIVYDMDTSRQISEYSLEAFFWRVYKDKIYYRTWDEGIFRMDPLSGESELIYACDGGSDLMIRDNGDMLIMKGDRMVSDEMEFWLLSHDEQGDLSAKKIWETDEYMETAEFIDRGLFILGEYNYDCGGGFLCLKDNGEVEMVVIEKGSAWARSIITEEGYFLWDSQLLSEEEKQEILFSWDRDQREKAVTVVDSISYYDFQGNEQGIWRLIDDEMLEAGYRLVHIVYGNGAIFAFYENEELDDLYISKVQIRGTHAYWEYVDFYAIEENHEILKYDICAEPRYDWENTLLEGILRPVVEEFEEFREKVLSSEEAGGVIVPLDIHYFPFDFNDDGLEDYLVCITGSGYFGSGGNSVGIYVQEEGGTLKEVLSITDRLHQGDGIHARFTVLNEKTDGYYAIVLTSNRILRYDSDTGRYEFHEGE